MNAPATPRLVRRIGFIGLEIGLLGAMACTADLGGLGGSLASVDAGVVVDGAVAVDGTVRDAALVEDSAIADAGAPDAALRACDDYPSGSVQRMPGYSAAIAKAPATQCDAGDQTRTCSDGSWSAWQGMYIYSTCAVEGYASCDGQPHGTVQTKYVYGVASAASASLCAASAIGLSRTCSDGVWSEFASAPANTVSACTVAVAGTCVALGDLAAYPCAMGSHCSGLAGRCVLAQGAACTSNAQCADACVAGVCGALAAPGGTCDEAADCTGCTAGSQCLSGICKCKDLSFCTANTDCAHTCRANSCAAVGVSCDAHDQDDCGSSAVCRPSDVFWLCFSDIGVACTSDNQCQGVCIASHCAAPSQLFGACDNDDDCDSSASKCSGNVCLADSGEPCASATGCASGVCETGKVCK